MKFFIFYLHCHVQNASDALRFGTRGEVLEVWLAICLHLLLGVITSETLSLPHHMPS
jgi:hypothetical protein